jgi:hypothetical protein
VTAQGPSVGAKDDRRFVRSRAIDGHSSCGIQVGLSDNAVCTSVVYVWYLRVLIFRLMTRGAQSRESWEGWTADHLTAVTKDWVQAKPSCNCSQENPIRRRLSLPLDRSRSSSSACSWPFQTVSSSHRYNAPFPKANIVIQLYTYMILYDTSPRAPQSTASPTAARPY